MSALILSLIVFVAATTASAETIYSFEAPKSVSKLEATKAALNGKTVYKCAEQEMNPKTAGLKNKPKSK